MFHDSSTHSKKLSEGCNVATKLFISASVIVVLVPYSRMHYKTFWHVESDTCRLATYSNIAQVSQCSSEYHSQQGNAHRLNIKLKHWV